MTAAPPQGGGQAPPCFNEFLPLRQEAEKRAGLIKSATTKQLPREEVCKLFNGFIAAESKLVKFLEANYASCGIPTEAVTSMKSNHDGALKTRNRVCQAAASAPVRPAGPSLSDALGARTPGPGSASTGGGTWDTLSGNPIK